MFPTQGSNPGLPHWRQILSQLSHKGSLRILGWVAYSSPGDLPNPGIKPGSPALQADSSPAEPPGKPKYNPRRENTSEARGPFFLTGHLLEGLRPHSLLPCTGAWVGLGRRQKPQQGQWGQDQSPAQLCLNNYAQPGSCIFKDKSLAPWPFCQAALSWLQMTETLTPNTSGCLSPVPQPQGQGMDTVTGPHGSGPTLQLVALVRAPEFCPSDEMAAKGQREESSLNNLISKK